MSTCEGTALAHIEARNTNEATSPARVLRGEERTRMVASLQVQLPSIRRAWMQGRSYRSAVAHVLDIGAAHRSTPPGIGQVVTTQLIAMDTFGEHLWRAFGSDIERCAFGLDPGDPSSEDRDPTEREWIAAWMDIAFRADIPDAVALDVIDLSADDYRRSRRRRARRQTRTRAEELLLIRRYGGFVMRIDGIGTPQRYP